MAHSRAVTRPRARFTFALIPLCLGGCNGAVDLADGIAPVLQGPSVEAASSNRSTVLDGLRRDAGYGNVEAGWYDVTLAGFNYVDDACSAYFDRLFKLNRRKDAIRSTLSVGGQTTNAILFATKASQLSMAVVAQAFGLASSLTDIVSGTYLYQLPPATTKSFVAKLSRAYREGAAQQKSGINGPASAYGYVRGYLDLCLTATIEASLVEHVGAATAVPVSAPGGSSVGVKVGSERDPEVAAALQEPASATTPLPPQGPRRDVPRFSALISTERLKRIQALVCVPSDGQPGPATDQAIRQFLLGRNVLRPDTETTGITSAEVEMLTEEADLAAGKTCAQRGVKDAFDAGEQSR
ncbi:MAG: hypothetical protein KJ755_04350 [Alphaproteobacteria bacterium]|nr:hypothetical protein [Alphaproteobacteria bacterium]